MVIVSVVSRVDGVLVECMRSAARWGFAEARAGDVCLVVPRADDRRAGVWRRPGERRATTTSQGRRRVDGAAAERSYDLDAVEQTRRRLEEVKRRRAGAETKGKGRGKTHQSKAARFSRCSKTTFRAASVDRTNITNN